MLPHFHFDELSSTQDKTFELFDTNSAPFLVTAHRQLKGRGRNQREWLSEPGRSLIMSLGVSLRPSRLLGLTLMVGLSVHEALRMSDLKIKWPNDLMLHDHKVGGILVESRSQGGVAHIAIGIGINLLNLQMSPYRGVQKQLDANIISENILKDLSVFEERGFRAFKTKYESVLWRSGENIRLRVDGQDLDVKIAGVSDDGLLMIENQGLLSMTDQGEIIHG